MGPSEQGSLPQRALWLRDAGVTRGCLHPLLLRWLEIHFSPIFLPQMNGKRCFRWLGGAGLGRTTETQQDRWVLFAVPGPSPAPPHVPVDVEPFTLSSFPFCPDSRAVSP